MGRRINICVMILREETLSFCWRKGEKTVFQDLRERGQEDKRLERWAGAWSSRSECLALFYIFSHLYGD